MATLTVVKDDRKIKVDGEVIKSENFDIPDDIHAIQWDGEKGHIEYKDGSPNKPITDQKEVQKYIDQFRKEKKRKEDED